MKKIFGIVLAVSLILSTTPVAALAEETTSGLESQIISAPESQEPSAPESQEPSAPESQEPSAPESQEPSVLESQEPSAPESQEASSLPALKAPESTAVAGIGSTTYATLGEALEAAQDGDTVKMLENIVASDSLDIDNDVTATLDFNGKKLSGETYLGFYSGIWTLQNVDLEGDGGYGVLYARNAGTKVTVVSGTINGTLYYAINGDGEAQFTLLGGTYTGVDSAFSSSTAKAIIIPETCTVEPADWLTTSPKTVTFLTPADYSEIEAALDKVPEDLSIYTPESVQALQSAIDAVVYDYMIGKQEEVDEMAANILTAIDELELLTVSSEPASSETVRSQPTSSETVSSQPTSSETVSSEPVSSETVSSESSSSTGGVRTGDSFDMFWIALALLSGLSALVVWKKRQR